MTDRDRLAALGPLDLLNSLGIAGPNIRHAEQGMYPDGKHSADDTWDGPGWCVCGREWPCEAKRLYDLVARDRGATPMTCGYAIQRGPRAGQDCRLPARFIVLAEGRFACATHAQAWARPDLARIAYWDRKQKQWP